MKNFCWLLVLLVLLFSSVSVFACWGKHNSSCKTGKQLEFEIIPTMDTESNAKNVVWVGTFQLIWNDLIDEIVQRPVEFTTGKSVYASNLNKKEFTIDDLREESYYKKLGLASKELKNEIEAAIKAKFNEKSDILGRFNWTPAPNKYILYAMLKKDFEYIKPFDKLDDDEFRGSNGKVKYFGIDEDSKSSLRYTVGVLFYNNREDFALTLRSKEGDTVYLYRTNNDKKLSDYYSDMLNKANKYMGIRSFSKRDRFKAPYIDFKRETEFGDLCNKPIKNTDFMIMKAIETVQFKMDEAGVKLKSEAGMMVGCTCCPGFRDEPRYFYCDGRYVIFLQEKNKPYFAMRVDDAKALQDK